MRCAVNPETGREYELLVPPEKASGKRVVIVGAGPAGMEAACCAAVRGFNVTLFEKADCVGGSLVAASVPDGKEDIKKLVKWYERELKRLGIKVVLGTEYTDNLDQIIQPDILLNAVGADFQRMIPGSDQSNVITAVEALKHPENVGKKVVIIGGGNTGCETAEYFSDGKRNIRISRVKNFKRELEYEVIPIEGGENRQVTIIEFFSQIGEKLGGYHKPIMDIKLKTGGVRIMTSTKVTQIYKDGRIDVEGLYSSEKETLYADTVILAGGMRTNMGVKNSAAEIVQTIGDCNEVGKIEHAIYNGYFTVREI